MTATVHLSTPFAGAAQLLLDSGERNVLTWELNEQLALELVRLREEGVRVVVLGSAVELDGRPVTAEEASGSGSCTGSSKARRSPRPWSGRRGS